MRLKGPHMRPRHILLLAVLALVLGLPGNLIASSPDVNEGGGGGGGGTWCLGPATAGHQEVVNGNRYECTEGRGAYWSYYWLSPYGYLNGYPQVLDCPCWYYRYIG